MDRILGTGSFCCQKIKNGTAFALKSSMPRYPYVGVAAAVTSWYGKRVFLVYGPQIITELFIKNAVKNSTFPLWSSFAARWIWAPAVVPEMVGVGSWIVGFGVGYVTILFGNALGYGIYRLWTTSKTTEHPTN